MAGKSLNLNFWDQICLVSVSVSNIETTKQSLSLKIDTKKQKCQSQIWDQKTESPSLSLKVETKNEKSQSQ
jgi:hypothetical protein